MAQGYHVLSEDEVQDFYTSIQELGFSDKDFELTDARLPPSSAPFYTITGTVMVKRKTTGVAKTYAAGHGSTWLATFHDDLSMGIFGSH